jgi:hypothetical protein
VKFGGQNVRHTGPEGKENTGHERTTDGDTRFVCAHRAPGAVEEEQLREAAEKGLSAGQKSRETWVGRTTTPGAKQMAQFPRSMVSSPKWLTIREATSLQNVQVTQCVIASGLRYTAHNAMATWTAFRRSNAPTR